MVSLSQEVYLLIHDDGENYTVGQDDARIYYSNNKGRGYFTNLKNYKFLILYYPRNKAYTNIDYLSSIDSIRAYIEDQNGKKVHIRNGEIEADSNAIREKWGNYKNLFNGVYYYTNGTYYESVEEYEKYVLENIDILMNETIKSMTEKEQAEIDMKSKNEALTEDKYKDSNDLIYVDYNIGDFEIYMTYDEEFELNSYETYMLNILKVLQDYEDVIYASVPICGIFSIIIIVYLVMAIGYKKNKENIELNDIDKIPAEIIIGIVISMIALIGIVTGSFYSTIGEYYKLFLSEIITAYFVIYILCAIAVTTVIKRIKAKTILKNTITWRMLKLLKRLLERIKKVCETFLEKVKITWKIFLYALIYVILMIFIMIIFNREERLRAYY